MLPPLAEGLSGVAPEEALDALRRSTATLREQAQRRACAALKSRRCARLLLELGRIASGGGALAEAEELQAPAKSFTSGLLDRRMQRVLARVGRRKPRSAAQLHALRIAVKKLRYAVEFFGPLYEAAQVPPFREALVKLQDCLGAINDAHAMLGRVRAAVGADSRLVDCAGGWSARLIHEEKMQFRTLWREFRDTRAFW
ncbi:MAG: CHAD domain-containing protein [Betaproteobacteria bacterium]|nr:MAG: CHAD domain-containing protein [Betaproteobacteria bacterium]